VSHFVNLKLIYSLCFITVMKQRANPVVLYLTINDINAQDHGIFSWN